MRFRLQNGRQEELVLLAKGKRSWKEFATLLSVNEQYLSREIRNERRSLHHTLYKTLCALSNRNFDRFIRETLQDYWGQMKGGMNSSGSTIRISLPEKSEQLAELVGALLGDGNITRYVKGKKVRVYQIKIAGDYRADRDYHINYLKPLFDTLFSVSASEILVPKHNERFLLVSSKEAVDFFRTMGLKDGNKIRNNVTIPRWVWNDDRFFLRACVRGLIDTDGSLFRMSKKDSNLLRLSFTNHDETLLRDTRKAFVRLGLSPSNITMGKRFYISKKGSITQYLKTIGFSNNKHKERLTQFTAP